jgi:hypothetical protein
MPLLLTAAPPCQRPHCVEYSWRQRVLSVARLNLPQPQTEITINAESQRLQEARDRKEPWKKWGPYLSERPWGTVREDYSENGNAWDYFSHDHPRSRAYRWGEVGLAGICDDAQRLCFALSANLAFSAAPRAEDGAEAR